MIAALSGDLAAGFTDAALPGFWCPHIEQPLSAILRPLLPCEQPFHALVEFPGNSQQDFGPRVRDQLHNHTTASAIEQFKSELPTAETIESVRIIEAQAAKLYWQAWSDLPVCWPRNDEKRIPEHWKKFNSRISPLTRSPCLAANPPNAILNLLYAVLEAESRISAVAMGLDPGIGLLHVDTPNRDSLACDLMEPVRPAVDAFVLDWLQREPLRKADFVEDSNGNARMASALAIKLCETADTWRKLVAPVTEYVRQELWLTAARSLPALPRRGMLATRLTQRSKREVKGSDVPVVALPKVEHHCHECGAKIPSDKERCSKCWKPVTRVNFRAGRKAAPPPGVPCEAFGHATDAQASYSKRIDTATDTGFPLCRPCS